jgi:hypothetical protein
LASNFCYCSDALVIAPISQKNVIKNHGKWESNITAAVVDIDE